MKTKIRAVSLVLPLLLLLACGLSRPAAAAFVSDAGGPYSLELGSNLMLDASGSDISSALAPVTYSWDINADGLFDFPGGPTLEILWTDLVSFNGWSETVGEFTDVTLRITDAIGISSFDRARVTVVAPGAIPIPAAAWLFGSALLGLIGLVKRRRRGPG